MAMVQGLTRAHKHPTPPKSPAGFMWPSRPARTHHVRKEFGAAIAELLRERGMDHIEFARALFGEKKTTAGHTIPRNAANARGYTTGKGFPTADTAGYIAQLFNVPMQRLLEPAGKARQGNGADHAAAVKAKRLPHAPPPPLELLPVPADAPPLIIKTETYPADRRFMVVSVSGTLQTEQALAMLAMLTEPPPAAAT